MLVAIGWEPNLAIRPELAKFHDQIALWSDCYQPPENHKNAYLLKMPYLGKNFEFTEKMPGKAPYLRSIYCVNGGSMLSFGLNIGVGLSGMKNSIGKLVHGISYQIFIEDADYYYDSLENYDFCLFEK